MESEKQTWLKAALMSGAVFGERRGSLLSNAFKSILPRAQAAGQVQAAPAAAGSASLAPATPTEPALDPQDPIMANRRNLVGKSYSVHMHSSSKGPKYDDLTSEVSGLFHKQIQDGFTLEVQRMLGARFMTSHRIAIGQRNQEDPPSNYNLMTHLAMKNGLVLVGMWSASGNMMARVIKDIRGGVVQLAYNSQTDLKGQESTSTEFDYSVGGRAWSVGFKYGHQMTPQGGGGMFEVSYVRNVFRGLWLGIYGMLLPNQARFMPSMTVRYETSFKTEAEELAWQRNLQLGLNRIQTLTEDDALSAYEACVLAASFFKPKSVLTANIAPLQGLFEFGYARKLSPSITLGSQFSLSPAPPNPQNPAPSLIPKWSVGYEYNSEPVTSVKVHLTNLQILSATYEDALMSDYLTVSVSAQANWPKDSYKTGFGLGLKL